MISNDTFADFALVLVLHLTAIVAILVIGVICAISVLGDILKELRK